MAQVSHSFRPPGADIRLSVTLVLNAHTLHVCLSRHRLTGSSNWSPSESSRYSRPKKNSRMRRPVTAEPTLYPQSRAAPTVPAGHPVPLALPPRSRGRGKQDHPDRRSLSRHRRGLPRSSSSTRRPSPGKPACGHSGQSCPVLGRRSRQQPDREGCPLRTAWPAAPNTRWCSRVSWFLVCRCPGFGPQPWLNYSICHSMRCWAKRCLTRAA